MRIKPALGLQLLLGAGFLLHIVGCATSNQNFATKIKLVVPVGFRGGVLIPKPDVPIKDSPQGTEVVSADGWIKGDQAALFYGSNGFSISSATWSDGRTLPNDLITNLRPDEVGLRDISNFHPNAGIWEFVGTYEDWKEFINTLGKRGRLITH